MTLHLSCIDHATPGAGARPRQIQYPEHEGWVFVCAAHPFPYARKPKPLQRPLRQSSPQNEIRNAPACRVPKILSQKLKPINAPTSHKVKQTPQRFQVTVHSAKDMPPE